MLEFLQTPESRLVILVASTASLMAIGFYVIRKVRPSGEDDRLTTNDMMSKFRELHGEGGLSDDEYRTIKTNLNERLKEEFQQKAPKDNQESKDRQESQDNDKSQDNCKDD